MRIVKLNRNYNGYYHFSHRIEFWGPNKDRRIWQWIQIRNWLWQNFGPSAEQELARPENFGGVQPKWAWDTEKSAIYLRDEALVMVELRKEYWKNAQDI